MASQSFKPSSTLIPGNESIRGKALTISANNRVAPDSVPTNKKDQGFEVLIAFLLSHPLKGAYFLKPSHIYPKLLGEWWYTCVIDNGDSELSGTILDGTITITITKEILRRVLQLPFAINPVPVPTFMEARQHLNAIGYDQLTGSITFSHFSPTWHFIALLGV